MPGNDFELVKKLLPIIFVIDTSGSMSGTYIASVNEAMEDTLDTLKAVAEENADAEVLIGALSFSTGCKWLTNGLLTSDDFYWNPVDATGLTDLGAALDELNKKMSRSAFFANKVGYNRPVLIFMTDGFPNDDWEKALDRIKQNKWFVNSIKVGIAIGADADQDVLIKVIGDREGLIEVNNQVQLKNMIKKISLSASKIGSVSRPPEAGSAAKDIVKDATSDEDDVITNFDDDNDQFGNPVTPTSDTADTSVPDPDGGWDDGGW